MNRRISGWKLALLLLIPLALIAAAIWIGLQALSDDNASGPVTVNDDVVTSTQDVAQSVAPSATQVAVTQPVAAPQPTAPPTALPVPTAAPTEVPAPTAVPEPTAEPTPVPAPTAAPVAPAATAVPATGAATSGGTTPPAATETAAPIGDVVITCGQLPSTLDAGEEFGPFEAKTVPPTAASALRFKWNFGNGYTVGSANTPVISYAERGTYTVSVTGTDIATGQIFERKCGTITVGTPAPASVTVKCSVKPQDKDLKIADALPGDMMVVTVSWTPADVPLRLTYAAFSANAPLILVNDDASPNVQQSNELAEGANFDITWQYREKDLRGQLSCPAYPK